MSMAMAMLLVNPEWGFALIWLGWSIHQCHWQSTYPLVLLPARQRGGDTIKVSQVQIWVLSSWFACWALLVPLLVPNMDEESVPIQWPNPPRYTAWKWYITQPRGGPTSTTTRYERSYTTYGFQGEPQCTPHKISSCELVHHRNDELHGWKQAAY